MPDKTSFDFGTFCWVDLTTIDREKAKRFYSAVLGWTYEDLYHDGQLFYTMCHVDGKAVAGMFEMIPEHEDSGLPRWTHYVCVEDIHATAAQIEAAGGAVLLAPRTIMDSGTLAIVQDPADAVLGLWQPHRHKGMAVVEDPGSLLWMELDTPDADGANQFYASVFGWHNEVDPDNYQPYYTLFARESAAFHERLVAGMLWLTDKWNDLPAHWVGYFGVTDIDAAVEKVLALGGQKYVGIVRIPYSQFAVLEDPQGAAFGLMQPVMRTM